MRVGINLLWVRPGKNGGTESYIRNILDGLALYSVEETYYLYISKDNADSFEKYFKSKFFVKRICNVENASQGKRIMWENLNINRISKKDKLEVWFMPVYSKPFFLSRRIPCLTTIHDIQAIHYPEYFSLFRNLFFRLSWWWDCKFSNKIITISEFCKQDILNHFNIDEEKIEVIYNPIIAKPSDYDFNLLAEKYKISVGDYFYTVSALAKHKNLITLLKAMKVLKDKGIIKKLLITGVKVNANEEITQYIVDNQLSGNVIFTGYILNEERDSLYDHCKAFLFPSVFEGFGMPPIEALMRGVPVITTKETSIFEVTQGKAIYVSDPFDELQWVKALTEIDGSDREKFPFKEYELQVIVGKYRKMFVQV